MWDTVGGRKSETRRIRTKSMDEQIVEKTSFWRTREILKKSDPHEKRKMQKNAPKKPFSGHGSAFFGFLMLFSSFWPDSRPNSPNLGRIRAMFLFWGVLVQCFMLQESHFPSTCRIYTLCTIYDKTSYFRQ